RAAAFVRRPHHGDVAPPCGRCRRSAAARAAGRRCPARTRRDRRSLRDPAAAGVGTAAHASGLAALAGSVVASCPCAACLRTMPDLAHLIQSSTTPAWLYLPLAALLGALHALEPGHAKSLMAAYIVAIRGTTSQAATLALSAAVGHTIVVWALAITA